MNRVEDGFRIRGRVRGRLFKVGPDVGTGLDEA